MKRAAALAIASLAPLASGCVAALVPLAAGAALVKTQSSGAAPPPVAPAAAAASDRGDLKLTVTRLTELPPPDAAGASGNPAVPAFRSYALSQADLRPGTGRRASAIVPAASRLRAERAECGALPPAVFIDLDPGRNAFDPLAPGHPDHALAAALAELRGRGVRIVWFSRLGASFADVTRATLAQAGLDPLGSDELVLMPGIEERKQSLRDEVARRLCPIALLGDERADFDELYHYLKRPDAAVALEAMIGNGWFLARPFMPGAAPLSKDTP